MFIRGSHWSVLSQINPVHTLKYNFSKIHFNISRSFLDLPSGLFPSRFPIKTLFPFLIFPTHDKRPACQIPHDLIPTISGEEYTSRISSMCNYLHPPNTTPTPTRIRSKYCSQHSLYSTLNVTDLDSHHLYQSRSKSITCFEMKYETGKSKFSI
jgi:hypothetical protein